MPRPYLSGCAQHIIQRGNNRTACFNTHEDYTCYLHHLREAAAKYKVAIHAFVLMTNHVHLLATPKDKNGIGRMMQALGRRYVQHFNYNYERTGTLWEGRYKSTLVDSEEYLLTVYRYIELNPVRAQMVQHAADYPWSSYQHNAVGKPIVLITPHQAYEQLGLSELSRQAAYRALFKGRIPEATLEEIRAATNKAWLLGSDRFKAQFSARTGRPSEPSSRGGDRKSEFYKSGRNQ